MPVIFISHALRDKTVIDDLFDLLQTGCDMRREEIFCSSVESAGIETGSAFLRWIQEHMEMSTIVILFLTPNYYASKFCLAEMGAAWALKKEIFPILLPDMKRDPGSVLIGRQTAVVDETGLDNMRDVVIKHYPPASKGTARWSLKRGKFLESFRVKVKSLPQPEFVDQGQLDEEKQKTIAAMELNEQMTKDNKILEEQITALKKLKDKDEVARIEENLLPQDGKYERLVKEAEDALSPLSIVDARCIYASVINEIWLPSREVYKDVEDSVKKSLLSKRIMEKRNNDGDIGLIADSSHPRFRPAFRALEKLDYYIAHDMKIDERERLEEKYKIFVDINSLEYWEEILLRFRMPA